MTNFLETSIWSNAQNYCYMIFKGLFYLSKYFHMGFYSSTVISMTYLLTSYWTKKRRNGLMDYWSDILYNYDDVISHEDSYYTEFM